MKDFKVGDNIFVLKRDYLSNILNGIIIKIYPNSNRFRIKYDFNKIFSRDDKERFVERFQDDDEVFNTYKEAYHVAMDIFNQQVEVLENRRQNFIKDVTEDLEKGRLIKSNEGISKDCGVKN